MSVEQLARALGRWGWAALVILIGYSILAASSELGIEVAGQGLDPVWAAAQSRGTLRIAVDYGFRPFTDIQGDQPRGYDIDLARAVATKLGLRTEFVPSGLDSIYDDIAAGKADIAISALPYAPEQGWRVQFSEFYFNAGQVLVVRTNSPITTEDDLIQKRVGVALGSDADTYARTRAQHQELILDLGYDTPADALNALREGKLDAVITDNLAALIAIQQYPELHLVKALTFEPYTIAMSSGAFQLHTEVNRALAELRQEGFFEQNAAKWFREQPTN